MAHLKAYTEQLKDRLLPLPEVAQVNVMGFSDHQLRIEIPDAVLQQFGLSAVKIADAIARQAIDLPAGRIEAHQCCWWCRLSIAS